MSEYQYVALRAIDGPVSDKNLKYMEQQSSRADVTPWSFDNEYNYGDFRGNAVEMLRRGYDLFFHYANFGIRKLLIRLPHGLPDKKAAKPYLTEDGLDFIKDERGPGGILQIQPFYESCDLEQLHDIEDVLKRVTPIRAELLDGDLRPLYIGFLAMASDANHDPTEVQEPPVPAGLGELTDAQLALAEIYGLSKWLLSAAAQGSPPMPSQEQNAQSGHKQWLAEQSQSQKDAWLAELMSDSQACVRARMIAEFRQSQQATAWPTVRLDRTLAELQATAEEIRQQADRKSAEKAAREKAKRMANLAADPHPTLQETEKLIKQRTTKASDQIAQNLAELRDALVGTSQAGLAEKQAKKLRAENPTLRSLVTALRQHSLPTK